MVERKDTQEKIEDLIVMVLASQDHSEAEKTAFLEWVEACARLHRAELELEVFE